MSKVKFTQDWDFQQRMQKEHALDLYQERFPGCEIIEADSESAVDEVAQIFDWAGVDKIIRKQDGTTVLVSQRFRRRSVGQDFSLTYERPNANNPVEFERLKRSLRDDYSMTPKLYGFGVADDIKGTKSADGYAIEQGFQEFHLVKIEPLIRAIHFDEIDIFIPPGTSNGNGNKAAYIDTDVLVENGLTDRSWVCEGGSGKLQEIGSNSHSNAKADGGGSDSDTSENQSGLDDFA